MNILEHRKAIQENIEKAFNGGVNLNEELEKARSGIYADTAENRKLNRVGQQYGGKKQNVKVDKNGNPIGDGNFHVKYKVESFDEYPQIKSSVSKSNTTESVYVTYRNTENGKSIKVRFSNHENNATKFGDELNGHYTFKDEILYHLGLRKREFVPLVRAFIPFRQVSRKDLKNGVYSESKYTIEEMYDKVKRGESISDEVGKLAKNSNHLILRNGEMKEETRKNIFGETVKVGDYIYKNI